MTPDEAVRLLRRGRCTAAKLAEAGCVTCEATDEAMRALVHATVRRMWIDALGDASLSESEERRIVSDAERIAREVVP